MIKACAECAKNLPVGQKHLSIIGCYDGEHHECLTCGMADECSLRLVYPDDASHGLCEECFRIAMNSLNKKRKEKKKCST